MFAATAEQSLAAVKQAQARDAADRLATFRPSGCLRVQIEPVFRSNQSSSSQLPASCPARDPPQQIGPGSA
jgi:hypothetical protein